MKRSAAEMAFIFDELGTPLIVAKSPIGVRGGVEREVRALGEVEPARVAPRYLGQVGSWSLQEMLQGVPLAPEPLKLKRAHALAWSKRHVALCAGLCRVAETTAKAGRPESVAGEIDAALEHPALTARTHAALAAAWRDVSRLRVSVLRHTDTSAQNCLFEDGRLVGIIDWEMAESRGAPGFDVWNAAIAYLESSIGLVRWSDERALQAFTRSWPDSGFWRGAREAGRRSAATAGVPESMLEALEVIFFGTRVGDHIVLPNLTRGTGIHTAIGMLEAVCSS